MLDLVDNTSGGTTTMHRRVFALAAVIALVITSCGSRAEDDPDAAAPPDDETEEPEGEQVDNGGATDVGVTGDEIVIGVIADLTGVVPGLFKAAVDAVEAHAAMVNDAGGIHGRMLRVEVFDTGTSDNGNRLAYEEACAADVFAFVGSFSAFDTGGYEAQRDCETPNLPATATDPDVDLLPTVYPRESEAYGNTGSARWYAAEFPDAVTKAGYFYVDAPVTERGARNTIQMRESVGWEFIYEQPISALESNYTPHVLEMERRGVQTFTMGADYNNTVRLQKALREQNYSVTIPEAGTQGYSEEYLEAAGPAAEGSFMALGHAMFEEADQVPAMADYLEWLERTAPGEKPSSNGLLAWTRALLFVEAAEAAGPELTREKLVEQLESMTEWDADGLMPPRDVGEYRPLQGCFIMVQVRDGAFTRVHPDEGFDCSPDYVYEYPES